MILGSKWRRSGWCRRGRVINAASRKSACARRNTTEPASTRWWNSPKFRPDNYRSAGVKFSMVLPSFVNTKPLRAPVGSRDSRTPSRKSPTRSSGLIVHPKPGAGSENGWLDDRGTAVMPPGFGGLNRLLGGEHAFTDDVDMEKRRTWARARGEAVALPAGVDQRVGTPVRVAHVLSVNLARVRANLIARAVEVDPESTKWRHLRRSWCRHRSVHAGVGRRDTVGPAPWR